MLNRVFVFHGIMILSIVFVKNSFSQNYLYKGSEEYRSAVSSFKERKYSEALPLFEDLIKKYPKDPAYHYYTGACMAYCNVNINTAIEYLKYASVKSVPYDVYYFLGRAYHYEGQFNEAIKYYNRFNAYSKRSEKEELRIDVLIEQCYTGIQLSINPTGNLTSKLTFAEKYLENYLNKLSIGIFYRSPVVISTELSEENINEETTIFIPSDALLNERVYVSGIKDIKQGIDVQLAKKTGEDSWGFSNNIGNVINSPYDDAYPFIDKKNQLLFFSCNGPQSMGGYDIFISKFDKENERWLPPVNPGFPINSTADDYLFVVKESDQAAYFVSNRNIHIDSVGLFALNYSENKQKFTDLGKNISFSKTKNNELANQVQNTTDVVLISNQIVDSSKAPEEKDPTYELNNILQLSYDELINSALVSQIKADSLIRASKVLRKEMAEKRTSQEKSLLYREIKKMENRAAEIQGRADILYQQARELELSEISEPPTMFAQSNLDEIIVETDVTKNNSNQEKKQDVKIQEENEIEDLVNTFEILTQSPYSDENPIPMDVTFVDGIVYRLQLGAYGRAITWDKFGGLTPVTGENIPERNITKYYVGLFTSTKSSEEALVKVRSYGYKDVFIVSYFNGKKISLQRARDIELSLKN